MPLPYAASRRDVKIYLGYIISRSVCLFTRVFVPLNPYISWLQIFD